MTRFHETDKELSYREILKNTPPIFRDNDKPLTISEERKTLTRSAFQLLEKVVETAVRLGLHVNKRDQTILSLVLEGVSYRQISKDFDMPQAEVSAHAEKAIEELNLFLNRLKSDEDQQHALEERIEREYKRAQDANRSLREEISKLKAENERLKKQFLNVYTDPDSSRKVVLNTPIHKLAISPKLQSVLIRAGYYTLQDALDPEATPLSDLSFMAPEQMKELVKFLKVTGIQV